jgi:hypothetical protein
MSRKIHLWPEEHGRLDDQLEVAAVLEGLRGKRTRIYFRLPSEESPNLASSADPFVIASAFHVLRAGADLEVHGTVSPSLLAGLEEFQAVWSRWRPERYRPFAVTADAEREQARAVEGRAVMVFSGGLDSCCTAWRHTRPEFGRRKLNLRAAVMLHGFDIPLDQADVYARALENSRSILETVDVPVIPVICNLRILKDDWEDVHGAFLASSLHLLAGGYSAGLIASSHFYEALRIPWGSNPITDPMLRSESFSIVHDGCDLTRSEKADAIGDWDAAQRFLRVCWEGKHLDRNCGVCLRCASTALYFAAKGRPIPPSIPISSEREAVERLEVVDLDPVQLDRCETIVQTARAAGINQPWVAALAELVGRRRQLPVDRGGWFPRLLRRRRR